MPMRATALPELLEAHAPRMTGEALRELVMHPRTPAFRGLPRDEVATRVGALYRNLGHWLAHHDDDAVRREYEDWGRTRFAQAVPLSELGYAVILAKDRLRRYAREEGLADLQAVEVMIGEFFDRTLYYLMRGYEMQAATTPRAASGGAR